MNRRQWSFALLIAVAIVVGLDVMRPTDATDAGRFKRSGMGLRIDQETGCHYLVTGSIIAGGITPRLDRNGQQICTGTE